MKNSVEKFLAVFLFLYLFASAPAVAGPARFFISGGADSALMGGNVFSEGDTDLEHPVSLIGAGSPRFSLTREYESDYYCKQGDKMDLITSKKKKMELFYPLRRRGVYRSAYAGDAFGSNLKISSELRLEDTRLDYKGSGSSNAFAQQFGPVKLGFFLNRDGGTGYGHSKEISDRIEWLAAGAAVSARESSRNEGVQIAADVGKRLTVSYLKSDRDVNVSMSFSDADDIYTIPGRLSGEGRETAVFLALNPVYGISFAFDRATLGNLDGISYSTVEIGRWLSDSEYEMKSFYLRKTPSANHETVFGFQEYDGNSRMAGTIDIFGATANLISGYYLYHASGSLSRRTLKYSTSWRRRNYTFKLRYDYSFGDAVFHFDSRRAGLAVILGLLPENLVVEDRNYDFSQHLLGLGVDKRLSARTVLKYSLVQVIPIFDQKETGAAPSPGPSTTTEPKKKVRGGTLHLFSLEYGFD
jgi:hypothetical protein